MDPQLENIILLQDLDLLIEEIDNFQISSLMNDLGFSVVDTRRLQSIRAEVIKKIEGSLLKLYDRLSRRHRQCVVMAIDNVCLGCFIAQPTQFSSEGNCKVHCCQSCSRILYYSR
jgi:hypothetical protein